MTTDHELPAACPASGYTSYIYQRIIEGCWRESDRYPSPGSWCARPVGDNAIGVCDEHLEEMRQW